MRRAESLVLTHISRFSAGFIPVGIHRREQGWEFLTPIVGKHTLE